MHLHFTYYNKISRPFYLSSMKQMAKDKLLHHCTVFQIPKKLLNFSLIIMQVISVAFYNLHVLGPQYIY